MTGEVRGVLVRPVVLLPAFAVISLVGARFPSFSVGANVLVMACGGGLFWLGVSARLSRGGPPRLSRGGSARLSRGGSARRLSARAAWWLLPAFVLVVVEFADLALGSTYAHPTLSGLADPLFEGYVGRAAGYFGWLTAYWGLVRL